MPHTELPDYSDSNVPRHAQMKALIEGKSSLKVIKPLGSGFYGSVALARGRDGTLFAVKVLKTTSHDPDRHVMMEAGINKAIGEHRRIVRMRTYFYSSSMGLFGMAFEFANWGSLVGLTERYRHSGKGIPNALIWSFYKDISESLLFLHSGLTAPEFKSPDEDWGGTIIHGDVAPGNIVLGPAAVRGDLGRSYPGARLTDFGLSRSVHDPGYHPKRLTGTLAFTAPEGETTPKGDVFGLGMCMYYAKRNTIVCDPDDMLVEGRRWNKAHGPEQEVELYKMIFKAIHPDPRQRVDSGILTTELNVVGREMRAKYFEPLPNWAYPDAESE